MNHQRPIWILIFAVMVAAIAIRLNAGDLPIQESVTQEDMPMAGEVTGSGERVPASEAVITASEADVTDAVLNGRAYKVPRHVRPSRRALTGRPKSVSASAALENFDADADPDGWTVQIALLDAAGRRVNRRATARFSLNPRVPTQDFTGYVTAKKASATWSSKLQFDEHGLARVRLPLRERLKPVFGWRRSPYESVGLEGGRRSAIGGIVRPAESRPVIRSGLAPSELYGASAASLGLPADGELRVTVSVPTEGTFRTTIPIQLRPAALVDTRWPYQ
ncbi:MAG: hypothetical protein AAFU85_17520 [Planctomycetota bacterium]